ncbi:hypothetical protein NLG97_g736 [Lecanicillium saksenae]|uniref:Uncharacterized protein n=1 Tax=Lecanicillium saksenae TaxID=468837 RepID=A0ACC1R7M2_9HYPO|nr:hypothetical protein NLG97_g736 [Lecanicillium saksenae]
MKDATVLSLPSLKLYLTASSLVARSASFLTPLAGWAETLAGMALPTISFFVAPTAIIADPASPSRIHNSQLANSIYSSHRNAIITVPRRSIFNPFSYIISRHATPPVRPRTNTTTTTPTAQPLTSQDNALAQPQPSSSMPITEMTDVSLRVLSFAASITGGPCKFILNTDENPFRGGQCVVYGLETSNGCRFAVRVEQNISEAIQAKLDWEVRMLKSIKDLKIPHLPCFVGYESAPSPPLVATSWADGCELEWSDSVPLPDVRMHVISSIAEVTLDMLKIQGKLDGLAVADAEKLQALISDFHVPHFDDAPYVLVHLDMQPSNIIMKGGKLSSVIDLGCASMIPPQFATFYPKFLTNEPRQIGDTFDWSQCRYSERQVQDRDFFLRCIKEKALAKGRDAQIYAELLGKEDQEARHWWLSVVYRVDMPNIIVDDPQSSVAMERLEYALPFLKALETLKSLKRAGWCKRNVPDPENVGNHMYQMLWYCYLHPDLQGEDETKAVMICIVHDMGEVTAGDITPSDGVDPKRKHLEEKLGVQYLSCLLAKSNPLLAAKLPEDWLEYETSEMRIAKLVHQIDKLECLHQAFIYRKRYGSGHKLEEFQNQRGKISDPWLAKQADAVMAEWVALEKQRLSSRIFFIIGGPGVGKGTVCARLVSSFGYKHISVGDLLRDEKNNPDSAFGSFIAESMQHSVIVPPSLTLLLLRDKIQKAQAEGRGVLVDGFPRSISSAYSTIFLECPTDIMVQRVQQRSTSSARDDDATAVLVKRIDTFLQTNESVLDHLSKNNLSRVDWTGSVDDVFSAVERIVQSSN